MISIALKDTLLPKEDATHRYDVDLTGTWNQFGLPYRLCIDGGPDFAGQDLSEACYRLGINIVDLPRMSPWYKGTVESTIKTLKTHFRQTYPGTPAYNLLKKLQLADPKKYADYAVMTIDDIKRGIVKWIVDIYHQQPRPGSSKTRQQVWDEGIALGTVPPPDPSFIQVATGRTKYGTLQHYGVQYNRLKYQSPELGKIRAFQEGGKSTRVKFVYYPEDCTRIDVQDPRTGEMIPAFAHRRRELEGMSHWQWNVLRRQFGKERDENINHEELSKARRMIQAMVAEVLSRKGSTARRKATAFLDSAQTSRALPPASPDPADTSSHPSSDEAHRSSTPPHTDQPQDSSRADADNDSDGWGGDYDNPRI
jgi:putative transposase